MEVHVRAHGTAAATGDRRCSAYPAPEPAAPYSWPLNIRQEREVRDGQDSTSTELTLLLHVYGVH